MMIKRLITAITLVFLLLLTPSPGLSSAPDSTVSDSTPQRPCSVAIGVVLIDAGNFDYPNATFQSTFWIWSVSENPDLDALINLDIRNAVATEVITDISSTEEGEHWHLQKIKGTFRNYWNLSKYPFDRQKLKIFLEEGELGIQDFSYCIDADSRSYFHSPNIKGWTLESLNIETGSTQYESNFGDPSLKGLETSDFAVAEITVELRRSNWTSFWRITSGAFISLSLSLSSFLLSFKNFGLLSARFGLLGGSAFANVISIRNVSAKTGAVPYITFIDQIHLIPMLTIHLGLIISLWNLRIYNKSANVTKCDTIDKYSLLSISSFSIISLVTIFSQVGGN